MGSTHYKKTVACECGVDYGSCHRHNSFVLKYNRSSDFGDIFVKRHVEEPDSKYEHLGTFNDNDLSALSAIINAPDVIEELLPGEREELKR